MTEQKTGYLSDEDYNFIYSNAPRVCVDLIILDAYGGIYLSQRDIEPYKHYWHTPGGRVRFKERLEDAIKRIAETEIKAQVKPIRLVGACEFLDELQNGNPRHSVSFYYEVKIINGEPPRGVAAFQSLPHTTIPEQAKFLKQHNII